MSKFKPGDRVVVTSCPQEDFVNKSGTLTKLDQRFTIKYDKVVYPTNFEESEWLMAVGTEIELEQVVESPLYKALS